MIEKWIDEIKAKVNKDELGMILVHNGVVRGTSKDGRRVSGMELSYDREKLLKTVENMKGEEGIVEIKTWINEGQLKVGDDIMYVLVAGRFRTQVISVLERILNIIKKEVVIEKEIPL
ncbi:MAG: molybdenum cofactor biosynthesis protein MoaE [Syntrophorhabdaceae bacterium]|nr:molybdenum cofactor biosynthesis protein MoaE [Syntrophorhabdaceae bacterium]